jgi:hypothetical protein
MEGITPNKLTSKDTNSVSEIDYRNPSANDQIAFYSVLEKSKNADRTFKGISELSSNGQFNKELFAGIMLFRAPRKLLISSPENAREVISFLNSLNDQLQDETLKGTIDYLESLVPYLEESNSLRKEMINKSTELFKEKDTPDTMSDLEEKADTMNKSSQAALLNTEAGVLFTNSVTKTYDALWNKYLIGDAK